MSRSPRSRDWVPGKSDSSGRKAQDTSSRSTTDENAYSPKSRSGCVRTTAAKRQPPPNRGGCRRALELEAILDELGNGVDRALAQVCSLVNDAARNALHPSHRGLRFTPRAALARTSLPTARLASAALALGGLSPAATCRLARASRTPFSCAFFCTSPLTSGGSGPRPLSTAL